MRFELVTSFLISQSYVLIVVPPLHKCHRNDHCCSIAGSDYGNIVVFVPVKFSDSFLWNIADHAQVRQLLCHVFTQPPEWRIHCIVTTCLANSQTTELWTFQTTVYALRHLNFILYKVYFVVFYELNLSNSYRRLFPSYTSSHRWLIC